MESIFCKHTIQIFLKIQWGGLNRPNSVLGTPVIQVSNNSHTSVLFVSKPAEMYPNLPVRYQPAFTTFFRKTRQLKTKTCMQLRLCSRSTVDVSAVKDVSIMSAGKLVSLTWSCPDYNCLKAKFRHACIPSICVHCSIA